MRLTGSRRGTALVGHLVSAVIVAVPLGELEPQGAAFPLAGLACSFEQIVRRPLIETPEAETEGGDQNYQREPSADHHGLPYRERERPCDCDCVGSCTWPAS